MQIIIIIVFWLYSILILSLSAYISYYISYNLIIDLIDDLKKYIIYLILSIIYFLIPYPDNYQCRISNNVFNRALPQINMT